MRNAGHVLWDLIWYASVVYLAASMPGNAARGEWVWFWCDVVGVVCGAVATVITRAAIRTISGGSR